MQKYVDACKAGDTKSVMYMLGKEKLVGRDFLLWCLYNACKFNQLEVFIIIVKHVSLTEHKNILANIFYSACKGGNIKIIYRILQVCEIANLKPTYVNVMWNEGILGACKGGKIDIFKMFIKRVDKEVRRYSWFIGLCMNNACKSGNYELVKYMVEEIVPQGFEITNDHLYNACRSGNIKVIDLVIKYIVNDIDLNIALGGACRKGHIEAVNHIIKKGASNYIHGLHNACMGGCISVVKIMLEKITLQSIIIDNWIPFLKIASNGGHIEIFKLLLSNVNYTMDLQELLIYAFQDKHLELVDILVKVLVKRGIAFNWNEKLIDACRWGDVEIVKYSLDKGAVNVNQGLEFVNFYNVEVINLLISRGANNFGVLKHTEDFQLYVLYCKFIGRKPLVNGVADEKYLRLLQKYPPYVFLTMRKHSCFAKLPIELFRTLFSYKIPSIPINTDYMYQEKSRLMNVNSINYIKPAAGSELHSVLFEF